jgi:CRISPR-associated protein Cmr6
MRQFILDLAGSLDLRTKKRPQDRRGQHSEKGGGQHPGLLLQRYLCENATGEGGNPEEKRAILQAAINAAGNPEVRELYQFAFGRWKSSLPELTAASDLQTVGRLIVGLGTENVLETGIRLHHTYGMPILPGSALKGLAAHYCHTIWGENEPKFKNDGDYHQLLFGTTDESGCITFHDAWFVPPKEEATDEEKRPLKLDVMTPHHPRWLDGSVPPTDFDSPTPVPFLSVSGKFHVAVSWFGPASDRSRNWTDLSLSLVADALNNWGVGGKTTSGYGRLAVPPPPPPPPPPRKRNSGDRAKVTIIATRTKGGFDVQDTEPGRNPGTLTVGSPPAGTNTSIGAVVDVLVHVDDERRPQYKWPLPAKK